MAVGYNGPILRTLNGGQSWMNMAPNDTNVVSYITLSTVVQYHSIAMLDASTAFVVISTGEWVSG
jgi:photosystem II stability/assembly factor-like uncharacterized protein